MLRCGWSLPALFFPRFFYLRFFSSFGVKYEFPDFEKKSKERKVGNMVMIMTTVTMKVRVRLSLLN